MQSASRLHITAKLGVSSLSGDSKNAHHSPALNRTNKKFYIYSDVPHTHPARRGFFSEEM